jgi:serine/threonine protein phosphatase 1
MISYVTGDIHGCVDALADLWEQAKQDAGGHDYRMILLGDYIDRGPDSKGVIDFILNHRRNQDIFLMGNHEDMLLANFENYYDNKQMQDELAVCFFQNGGWATLRSYGYVEGMASIDIPEDHKAFLATLRLFYETDDHLFVHAGIDPDLPLSDQLRFDLLWIREKFLNYDFEFPKYIVHGHTPINHDPRVMMADGLNPIILDHRCNLDTAGVFGGKFSMGVFVPGTDKPVNILETNGYQRGA